MPSYHESTKAWKLRRRREKLRRWAYRMVRQIRAAAIIDHQVAAAELYRTVMAQPDAEISIARELQRMADGHA